MKNLKYVRKIKVTKVIFSFILVLSTAFISAQEDSTIIVIKAGRLIDTESGNILYNQLILIKKDVIFKIGSDITISKNATIYDLSNCTVMPGLIDCHTHITSQAGEYYDDLFRKSMADYAILSPTYAKATLDAGFTTCRDLGSSGFVDVALRNAINNGYIPGPRLQVACLYISSTGGHGDLVGFSPWLDSKLSEEMLGIANGVDGVRKEVRYIIKFGADVIKFVASGGVITEEELVGAPQYTQEEMNAIVEEAKMWGRKTCAHAHGTEAIKMAIKAGVASVEHGSLIDDEGIRMMKEHGTYLVADIYVDDYIINEYTKKGYSEKIILKEKQIGQAQRENFNKAVKSGVKIAFGTDAGVYPHGWNGKQFSFMVKWGMSPMQAIQSATINAADLLGWKDKVGSLKVGKYADIIAVEDNPLDNISTLENVKFVMKGGVIYKNKITNSTLTD